MPLKERVFNCHNCGAVIDRDLNPAQNLACIPVGKSKASFA
ncbi:MAG: zinc ribbon domain-containing protein [Microcoleus sp.]